MLRCQWHKLNHTQGLSTLTLTKAARGNCLLGDLSKDAKNGVRFFAKYNPKDTADTSELYGVAMHMHF